jgi:hypothetical protein
MTALNYGARQIAGIITADFPRFVKARLTARRQIQRYLRRDTPLLGLGKFPPREAAPRNISASLRSAAPFAGHIDHLPDTKDMLGACTFSMQEMS